MPRRSLLAAGLLALPLVLPVSAAADTLFKMTRERTVERVFSIAGCGATAEQTVTAPARASGVTAVRPRAGTRIRSASEGEIFARVTDVTLGREAGRVVARFTAMGSDAACRPRGPDCAAFGEGCTLSGESEPVSMTIRYSRRERVYVTGTGRGGSRAYKPRILPFGMRSAIIGLNWGAWGSARTVGRGRVEFNPCVPDCARARPAYYPVRATLSRRRECNGFAQYLTLRFTYTTSARPPGFPSTYTEEFGTVCSAASAGAGSAVASAADVVDCDVYAYYPNVLISSARNMTCGAAARDMRRYKKPIYKRFTTPGGFRCARVSGVPQGGQWRCVSGARAFRFDFGD